MADQHGPPGSLFGVRHRPVAAVAVGDQHRGRAVSGLLGTGAAAVRVSTGHRVDPVPTVAFTPAPAGSEPDGALHAPMGAYVKADGTVGTFVLLDDLPAGYACGEIETGQAPQGARTVAGRIHHDWVWRLLDGEGWTVRQGKGPARDSGTRPKIAILERCRSVSLRAVGIDEAFPDLSHHVVLSWVQVLRTGTWSPDVAAVWTTEPVLGVGSGRPFGRHWAIGPTQVGVSAAKALLSLAPDGKALANAVADARAAQRDG